MQQYENIKEKNNLNAMQIFQNIWGVGPKLSKEIVSKNILSIKNLKKAIKNNKIKLTNQQKIGLKYYKDLSIKIDKNEIDEYTNYFKNTFKNYPIEIFNAGSYRSGQEFSSDIDLIITLNDGSDPNLLKNLNNQFYKKLLKENVVYENIISSKNINIYIVKLKDKKYFRKLDVIFIEKKNLPWYLLYFGSSVEFSKKIRGIASKLGYKLNQKGLFDKKTGIKIDFNPKNEKEIFKFLNIKYVSPINRSL